jgi:hypothetical protein
MSSTEQPTDSEAQSVLRLVPPPSNVSNDVSLVGFLSEQNAKLLQELTKQLETVIKALDKPTLPQIFLSPKNTPEVIIRILLVIAVFLILVLLLITVFCIFKILVDLVYDILKNENIVNLFSSLKFFFPDKTTP